MTFDVIDYPAAWTVPSRLTDVPSWHQHLPFAFAAIEMHRPGSLVELGTHKGDSYSAFCQAVVDLDLPTRCLAVDTWQGDSQAGNYPSQIFDELSAWHDPRYSEFSRLARMTFDEALGEVEDGSVDLLHIDGWHTYEAVRKDFETWRPKLSGRGVVLFHDVAVLREDFGVHRFWDEVSSDLPSLRFEHGNGLGILGVGAALDGPMAALLALPEERKRAVEAYFRMLGERVELLAAAAAAGAEVAGADLGDLRRRQLEERLREREAEVQRVYGSLSWRVTGPLRWLSARLRRR